MNMSAGQERAGMQVTDIEPSRAQNQELQKRIENFDQKKLFAFVDQQVRQRATQENFRVGLIEDIVVDFFNQEIFKESDSDFVYSPKFENAILEVLKKYQKRITTYTNGLTHNKDTDLPPKVIKKYLTLVYPDFKLYEDPSVSMQLFDVYMNEKLHRLSNLFKNVKKIFE